MTSTGDKAQLFPAMGLDAFTPHWRSVMAKKGGTKKGGKGGKGC